MYFAQSATSITSRLATLIGPSSTVHTQSKGVVLEIVFPGEANLFRKILIESRPRPTPYVPQGQDRCCE